MEQRNLQDNSEVEIDLLEVLHILLDRFWIILLSGIAGGLVFIAATLLFITPQYESTTKMYVLSKQDNNTITSSDMQTSLSLTKDYAELIKSRTVTEGVISKLNLDLTHEGLLGKMTIDSAADTRILSISVRDKDPYVACEIADLSEICQPYQKGYGYQCSQRSGKGKYSRRKMQPQHCQKRHDRRAAGNYYFCGDYYDRLHYQ